MTYVCLERTRAIPKEALAIGRFLEQRLPFRAVGTLTARQQLSAGVLQHLFAGWIRGLQAHQRLTFGYVMAIEPIPQRHIHTVLVAQDEVDCQYAKFLWGQLAQSSDPDSAKVEPYRNNIEGLGYAIKSWGRATENLVCSHNLSLFDSDAAKKRLGCNSGQRRQIQRLAQRRATFDE